jgi:guanylate kinase
MEMEQGQQFDYQVVNDDLQKAINEVDAIVQTNIKDII